MRLPALLPLLALAALCCSSFVHAHRGATPLALLRIENAREAIVGGATIKIGATQLKGASQDVEISWDGVPTGTDHWIGIYAPRPVSWTEHTPVKYHDLAAATTGSGSLKVNLINMRSPYTVTYFTGGHTHPVAVAVSEPVDFEYPNMAMQIHLAYTTDLSEMRVMWTSHLNASESPRVEWGMSGDSLNRTTRANTTTYTADNFCGAPGKTVGWHTPGYLHNAVLDGLSPNAQYFYRVLDDSTGSASEVYSFWSAPRVGADVDVDFILFGDLGQVETDGTLEQTQMSHSLETTKRIQVDVEKKEVNPALSAAVFHIGDVSYARGYESMWEQWFFQVQNTTHIMPWMTSIGNHERDFPKSGSLWDGTDSGGECGQAYENRFLMPTTPGAKDQPWWQMTYGPVHFIMLSTEHAFVANSTQGRWVAEALAKVNRTLTPFLIVTGHRPMYIMDPSVPVPGAESEVESIGADEAVQVTPGYATITRELREALEGLFLRYKVDVAMWGHHHSYQRTCPVHAEVCASETDGTGTIHIVTGFSGAGAAPIGKAKPKWIEVAEDTIYGYTRAHVRNHTLTLDFIHSATGVVGDSVTVQSKFSGPALERAQQERVEGGHERVEDIAIA